MAFSFAANSLHSTKSNSILVGTCTMCSCQINALIACIWFSRFMRAYGKVSSLLEFSKVAKLFVSQLMHFNSAISDFRKRRRVRHVKVDHKNLLRSFSMNSGIHISMEKSF